MSAIKFKEKFEDVETKFTYPEEMRQLIGFLESDGASLNVDYMTLEKLWYAFSETWCASFLIVDAKTYSDFKSWVSGISEDDANCMDYDGNILSNPYRPWEERE